MVAWEGAVGPLTLRVVWCGSDLRFGVNNVATTAAAVATYAALVAFPNTDLVFSIGTAGGFAQRGAAIADVFLSSKCVFHSRRIPDSHGGHLEEYGFGHFRSPALSGLAAAAELKTGVVSTSDSLDCSEVDLQLMMAEGAVVKEMEAAAVAWVAEQLQVPFVALKAITDLVDGGEATRHEFESNLRLAASVLEEKMVVVLALIGGKPLSHWAAPGTRAVHAAAAETSVTHSSTQPTPAVSHAVGRSAVDDVEMRPRLAPVACRGYAPSLALSAAVLAVGLSVGLVTGRWLSLGESMRRI
uniref:Nucleoside phosphorylase domain-containing protein n=1 Tax=Coccolithus braarudii TaxID=221442 RepID=A0A7S0LH18_9EUKA